MSGSIKSFWTTITETKIPGESKTQEKNYEELCIYGDTTLQIQISTELIPFTLQSIRREHPMLSNKHPNLSPNLQAKSGHCTKPYHN